MSNFSSPLSYLFISHTSTLTPPLALQNIIVIMHFPIEPFMDFHFIQDKLQTTHHSYTLAICLNYLFRLIYSFTITLIYKHHSHNAHSLYCSKASSFFQLLHIILLKKIPSTSMPLHISYIPKISAAFSYSKLLLKAQMLPHPSLTTPDGSVSPTTMSTWKLIICLQTPSP